MKYMFSRYFFTTPVKIEVFYSVIVFRQWVMIVMRRYFMEILWGSSLWRIW